MSPSDPYPPAYGGLYPAAETFAVAAHPVMDRSQPLVAWYDQAMGSANQGIGTYGDVHRAGDLFEHRPMNKTQQQIVRRNYYAATSYSDAQLGRMLAGLDNYSLTNHTVVVCFGDHGQGLGEHNLWEKMTVFETATRGGLSRRRDCHFADISSPSKLTPPLKGEGGAAE